MDLTLVPNEIGVTPEPTIPVEIVDSTPAPTISVVTPGPTSHGDRGSDSGAHHSGFDSGPEDCGRGKRSFSGAQHIPGDSKPEVDGSHRGSYSGTHRNYRDSWPDTDSGT